MACRTHPKPIHALRPVHFPEYWVKYVREEKAYFSYGGSKKDDHPAYQEDWKT